MRKPDFETSASPFSFEGLAQTSQQHKQPEKPQLVPESNKTRTFRRAGNACEIIAGSCLNSAVIFTFHLLQVHPIGMFLAFCTAHLYFTATAAGEGKDKFATNCMTGASASIALLCALSSPVGEQWEAITSTSSAKTEIQQMYTPSTSNHEGLIGGVGLALFVATAVLLIGSRGKR